MINKEEFRAKARFFRSIYNPGLKPGVIDNKMFVDFSPISDFLVNNPLTIISQKLLVLFIIPGTHVIFYSMMVTFNCFRDNFDYISFII